MIEKVSRAVALGAAMFFAQGCGSSPQTPPTPDAGPCEATGIWTGYSKTWLKTTDGRYWTLGVGHTGRSPDINPTDLPAQPTPLAVTVLPDTADLITRSGFVCFLSGSNVLRCADGGEPTESTSAIDGIKAAAFGPDGNSNPAILKTDGSVWNLAGGFGQLAMQYTAIGSDVNAAAVGYHRTCALKQDGTVWCWGEGYLGDGHDPYPAGSPQEPQKVTLAMSATAIAAGFDWTCALLADGTVWCWGSRQYGSAARDAFVPVLSPTKVDIQDVQSFSMGAFHACALKTDGTLWCWGSNFFGECGYAPDGYASANFWDMPAQVDALGASVVEVSAGYQHTCARKADATVWCWGNSFWGQAGSTKVDSPEPVVIRGCN